MFFLLFHFAVFCNLFSQVFSINDCGFPANLQDVQIPNLIGGNFKPHRTNFQGVPSNATFHIMIVFVQFYGETDFSNEWLRDNLRFI